jgi:uncharacterized membrane protein
MRKFRKNNQGSIYPVVIFIIIICIASVLILIINYVVEPFMNLMDSNLGTSANTSAARKAVVKLIVPVWTKGLLIVILLGSGLGLLMEYQKMKYQVG